MQLLTVGAILLMVGVGVRCNPNAGNDIVNLPAADSNAESCITDGLPTSTHCVVFEDTHRDFQLEIDHLRIFAHPNIIAGGIPYFRGPPGDVQSKIERLQQQHLDGSAVEALLRFAYTRQIRINDDNVEALLRAAIFLQMDKVVAACTELFTHRFNDNNIIHALNTATASNDTVIVNVATNYFLSNIIRLSASSDLPNLSADALAAVARMSADRATPAEPLFEAILGWTSHDPQSRSTMLCELMETIRFRSMTIEYLGDRVLPDWPRFKACSRVRQTVEEAIIYQMGPTDKHGLQRLDNATFWILHTEKNNSEMEVFEPALNRSRAVGNTPDKSEYCVVVHNCDIYAIGGSLNSSDSVHVYTEASNEWRAIESMIQGRSRASAVAVNRKIYVSGGFDDNLDNLASAESYDTQSRAWSSLASMHQARYHHRLVLLNDDLYAIGGNNNLTLNSVEKYDISRNEWTVEAPMLEARSMFAAAVLNKKIYVCGGYGAEPGGLKSLKSAEVFDPYNERWTAIAPMGSERLFFSLVAYMDQLWAFPDNDVSTTQVYDPKTDSWATYAVNLNVQPDTVLMRCESHNSRSDSYSQA